jgi:hypothetical protein
VSRKAAGITLLALSQRSGDPERAQRVEGSRPNGQEPHSPHRPERIEGSESKGDYIAGMTDTYLFRLHRETIGDTSSTPRP